MTIFSKTIQLAFILVAVFVAACDPPEPGLDDIPEPFVHDDTMGHH